VTVKATKPRPESCREDILQAALRHFAHRGYAGASIQDIVDEARVTKPALYYHFPSKEALYRALVDHAHDERYRLMQEGAARGKTTADQLTEISTALFEFSQNHQELMRLTLAATFAAPSEVPATVRKLCKGKRNFDFMRAVVAAGQDAGELDRAFTAEELAFGIYGQINTYIMVRLLLPDCSLDRRKASRVVKLFLQGAAGAKAGGAERRRGVNRRVGESENRRVAVSPFHPLSVSLPPASPIPPRAVQVARAPQRRSR